MNAKLSREEERDALPEPGGDDPKPGWRGFLAAPPRRRSTAIAGSGASGRQNTQILDLTLLK